MILKLIAILILLGGVSFLCISCARTSPTAEAPIDQAWWDGLSEEWRTLLLMNQDFSKQHLDINELHRREVNKYQAEGEADHSVMNTSLQDLDEMALRQSNYYDLHRSATKRGLLVPNDSIDLATLGDLEMIYMVGGPGDLTPLKKFPNLKFLILDMCGVVIGDPAFGPPMDLGPLRNLKKLEVLHCTTPVLYSIEPIKGLFALRELRLGSSNLSDLSPLKKLVALESLIVRTDGKSVSGISGLTGLKILHLDGFKKVPDLSRMSKLKNLCIREGEISIVNSSYRITSIDFLTPLTTLEYLDLSGTSYRKDLVALAPLQKLKAFTVPSVDGFYVQEFKALHKDCIIVNAYRYQ